MNTDKLFKDTRLAKYTIVLTATIPHNGTVELERMKDRLMTDLVMVNNVDYDSVEFTERID